MNNDQNKTIKLTLPQFLTLWFVSGWVAGQVIQAYYWTCLYIASLNLFIGAYFNNVHKILWASVLKIFKKLRH